MMKQQPFATKLGLSKMCRAIMVLVFLKISLLSAIVLDPSIVDITNVTLFNTSDIAKVKNSSSSSILSVSTEIKTSQQSQNDQGSINKAITTNAISADATLNSGTQQAINQKVQNLNSSNWDTNNGTFPVSTATQEEKNSTPSFFSSNNKAISLEYELLSAGIDSSNTPSPIADNKKSWWQNMLNVKNLPIPGFGTTSVAHAAALDNPPSPSIAPSTGLTNFTPSSQRLDERQNAAQMEANAKSYSTGTDNYQTAQSGDITQSITPPAPNVNTYTPTEDPNLKQKELIRREQELLMLKKQMEQRYSELKTAEERVNKLLQSAGNTNKNKNSALVSVYANMKPKQAAQALGKIDERIAVQILIGLKPKQAGEILSYADPEVTARLTELLTKSQSQ